LCAKESFGVDQGFTDAHCWCRTPPAPAQGYWSIGEKCADEGEICYCNGHVQFGARDELSDSKSVNGQVECSTNQFADVMPGVTKSCFCKSVNKYADNVYQTNAPNTGGWGGYCTCPDGSRYAVGDNEDSCGSLACVGGKPGSCSKTAGEWSNNKVTCGSVEDTNMLLVEESLVAEVNETAFVRWLIYGLAIFGCFIVVQKGVSLFQKEQEYNNIDQEC